MCKRYKSYWLQYCVFLGTGGWTQSHGFYYVSIKKVLTPSVDDGLIRFRLKTRDISHGDGG